VLTITETIVRNWERRRLAAEAHARRMSAAQLAEEERRGRLAHALAVQFARCLPAGAGDAIEPPPPPAPPRAAAVHQALPACPRPAASPPPPPVPRTPEEAPLPPRDRPPPVKVAINDIAAMVDHIQNLYYR